MISGFTPEGFSPLAGGRVLAHPIGVKLRIQHMATLLAR